MVLKTTGQRDKKNHTKFQHIRWDWWGWESVRSEGEHREIGVGRARASPRSGLLNQSNDSGDQLNLCDGYGGLWIRDRDARPGGYR